MVNHHLLDPDRPDGRFTHAQRAEVLAEARARVRELQPDTDGNLHISEVLDALEAP